MKRRLPWILRLGLLLRFLGFYVWEIVLCNLRVAYDVLTPRHHMRPAIVAVPLEALTDRQLLFLVNLITMTPGTVALDVSPDRRVVYVHALYAEDPEALRADIKQNYERRILDLF